MNKELINKYKAEFDHYLNDGSICFKTDIWFTYNESIHTDPFMLSRQDVVRHIIINDEYSTFRKALVEGKLVQVKAKGWSVTNEVWADTTHLCRPVEDYRIKPDEPKFKVGDWVTHPRCDGPFQYSKHDTCPDVELWKPQPGEWCVFHNNDEQATIARFQTEESTGYQIVSCYGNHTEVFKVCEPSIGPLPSHLQDK